MKKNLLILCSGLLLVACANPAETCAGYGFKPGTKDFAQCQMEVDAQNRSRAAAIAKASGNMGVMNKPFPQTTNTSCRRYGNQVSCNSITN